MADITECPVCLDEYKDPKLLPCSHTMCMTCLDNIRKSSAKKGKQQVTCPICNCYCKVPERGVTAFPDNQAMIQLIANNQEIKAMKQKMLELEKKEDGKENGTMSSVCEVTGPEVAEHNVQGTRNPADEATSEANGIVDGDKGNTPTNNVEENSEVNGIGGKMKNVSFQEIQEIDSDEPLEVIRTKSVIEAAAAAESSNDGEDLDITSILEEVLESAYKTKLFKQVVTDQKRGKHDQEKYDEQLQREYREIIKENKQRIMKSKFEKMMKALEKEETKKAQRPDVADVVPMYDGPPLSSTELVQVENQQNPDQENTVALPVWKRQSKKGGATFIPKPISDEEVKAMYRESLMMDELEAMVEEKKQEELKKRARKNPAVQTGPIKATPVTKKIEKPKPRAEAGRLLLKNPTMDDIMNAIAEVAKDNEEGEEIRCTARVYRADELTEEQRRKYDQFAVNGVYSENYESQEQTKPKKKKKNKKKKVPLEESEEPMGAAAFVDEGPVEREEIESIEGLTEAYKKIRALQRNGPIIARKVGSKEEANETQLIGRVHKVIKGKKGKGGKRGCVVVASLDRGERPRIGDYKGAYAPVYWKEPNTPVDYVEKTDEGLLTFSRQKLALIKCEYDPTCCNHCEKYSPADKLKTCDRCRFAKYCSRECQLKDWERKHKPHCKEIKRLKEIIRREEHLALLLEEKQKDKKGKGAKPSRPRTLRPKLLGEPWLMKMGITSTVMCIQGDKPIIYCVDYLNNVERYLEVFNPVTGDEEDMVCRLPLKDIITGITTCKIDNQDYIVVSSKNLQQYSEIQLWPYPLTWKPTCGWMGDFETCGTVCVFEGKLYMANKTKECVMEFHTSSTELVPTGLTLSTDIPKIDFVQSMCVTRLQSKAGKPKIIVLQYRDYKNESAMLCMDFKGEHLWTIIDLQLDGMVLQPSDLCTDHRGHIFAGDPNSNRVIMIKEDLTIETLIRTPEQVRCMDWCDEAQQLYVCTFNKQKTHMMFARFQLDEIWVQ